MNVKTEAPTVSNGDPLLLIRKQHKDKEKMFSDYYKKLHLFCENNPQINPAFLQVVFDVWYFGNNKGGQI